MRMTDDGRLILARKELEVLNVCFVVNNMDIHPNVTI